MPRFFVTDNGRRSVRSTKDGPNDLPEGTAHEHVASYPIGAGDAYVTMQDGNAFHVYRVNAGRVQSHVNRTGPESMPRNMSGGNTADVLYRLDQAEQAVVLLASEAKEEADPNAADPIGQGESAGEGVTKDRKHTSDATTTISRRHRFASRDQALALTSALRSVNAKNRKHYGIA